MGQAQPVKVAPSIDAAEYYYGSGHTQRGANAPQALGKAPEVNNVSFMFVAVLTEHESMSLSEGTAVELKGKHASIKEFCKDIRRMFRSSHSTLCFSRLSFSSWTRCVRVVSALVANACVLTLGTCRREGRNDAHYMVYSRYVCCVGMTTVWCLTTTRMALFP